MHSLPPDTDDLISRHFDAALQPAEHQRLTGLLAGDPAARRAFAAMARLHSSLESLAPPRPVQRTWWRTRGVVAAALTALLACTALLLWRTAHPPSATPSLTDTGGGPLPALDLEKPPGPARRVIQAPAFATPQSLEDSGNFFQNYYVNTSPDGLSLSQALAQLTENIRQENRRNRSGLDITATTTDDDHIVSCPITPPMPVTEYLAWCAQFGNISASHGLTPPPSPQWISTVSNTRLITHTIPMSSDIAALWAERKAEQQKQPPRSLSPFNPYPPQNLLAAIKAPRETLQYMGIHLAPEESAVFKANMKMEVRATEAKVNLIAERMALASRHNAILVLVSNTLINLPSSCLPPGFDPESGLIMEKSEYQRYLQTLPATAHINTCELPSVMCSINARSRLEIIKQADAAEQLEPLAYVGYKQSIDPSIHGELIHIGGRAELPMQGGVSLPQPLDALELPNIPEKGVIRKSLTDYDLWLPLQGTCLFLLDLPQEDGRVVMVCLSASLHDPAGDSQK